MDNQDLRTLKLLEEIDNDHMPSQRDLARKLNVSLGLVNSFIKRLAQKGYFKITSIPRNRVKYILTPKGAAEKARLTYEYIQYSFGFYKESRRKLKNLFKELSHQGVRNVVFYGISDLAEIAYISLQETKLEIVAIIDNKKAGEKFMGIDVKPPYILPEIDFDRILITDVLSKDEIIGKLSETKIILDNVLINL